MYTGMTFFILKRLTSDSQFTLPPKVDWSSASFSKHVDSPSKTHHFLVSLFSLLHRPFSSTDILSSSRSVWGEQSKSVSLKGLISFGSPHPHPEQQGSDSEVYQGLTHCHYGATCSGQKRAGHQALLVWLLPLSCWGLQGWPLWICVLEELAHQSCNAEVKIERRSRIGWLGQRG